MTSSENNSTAPANGNAAAGPAEPAQQIPPAPAAANVPDDLRVPWSWAHVFLFVVFAAGSTVVIPASFAAAGAGGICGAGSAEPAAAFPFAGAVELFSDDVMVRSWIRLVRAHLLRCTLKAVVARCKVAGRRFRGNPSREKDAFAHLPADALWPLRTRPRAWPV